MAPTTARATDEEPRRDVERLTYFSDAVIAIAVTLLVLPLADAASADEVTSLGALREQSGGEIFVFLLSFAVICRFWLVHHDMFLMIPSSLVASRRARS